MNKIVEDGKKVAISYTAIILNESSRKKLMNFLSGLIPEDWEIIAHHITLNLGEAKPNIEPYLNTTARFKVIDLGKSDMALAVGIELVYPPIKNDDGRKLHITIAINPNGGKPRMSNDIKNWYPINTRLYFSGKIEEVPFNINEYDEVNDL